MEYENDFEIFKNENHIKKSPIACLELIKYFFNEILFLDFDNNNNKNNIFFEKIKSVLKVFFFF